MTCQELASPFVRNIVKVTEVLFEQDGNFFLPAHQLHIIILEHSCGAPGTCFSICKRHCESNGSCVSFQCNSANNTCILSSCAAVASDYKPELSCYRIANVVFAAN